MIRKLTTKKNIYIFLFFLFSSTGISAQSDTISLQLKTMYAKDRVLLRWAADKPQDWQRTNKSGFIVERYTIARGDDFLSERELKILSPSPLLPAPEEAWEYLATNNKYAAIIAQALWGESFEVIGMGGNNNISQIADQTESLEQRHSFALLAADMSFESASLAAWGFVDEDVKLGDRYLYKIIPIIAQGDTNIVVEGGFDYIILNEVQNLLAPIDFMAEFGDKMVGLSWNFELMKAHYVCYWIEKSMDGNTFERLELPVSSFQESKDGRLFYMDSLGLNDQTYHYRIRGQSIFGEISPPSEAVSGKGIEQGYQAPQIKKIVPNKMGGVDIQWEFDQNSKHLLHSFSLKRASSRDGKYEVIAQGIVPEKRDFSSPDVKDENYFVISAESKTGFSKSSLPVLFVARDSTPPLAPNGLKVLVDTAGIAHIQWNKNKESDLLGYKLYRGNLAAEELIAITPEPIEESAFLDSLNLHELNEDIYYALKAFDQHYNQSDFSLIVHAEKPLKVMPSAPVFKTYVVDSLGISLFWINCPDKILAKHRLYRQEKGSDAPHILEEFAGNTTSQYSDLSVEAGKNYVYTISAVSKWGIESDLLSTLSVFASAQTNKDLIKSLNLVLIADKQEIKISWKIAANKNDKMHHKIDNVDVYCIYKANAAGDYSLWKEVNASTTQVIDAVAQSGSIHKYLIMARFKNGTNSNKKESSLRF